MSMPIQHHVTSTPCPFKTGDVVAIKGRNGLFLVEMPLAGLTWIRPLASLNGAAQATGIDTFEWTARLQPARLPVAPTASLKMDRD